MEVDDQERRDVENGRKVHSKEKKRSKRRETTNNQTHGDVWMNMFL